MNHLFLDFNEKDAKAIKEIEKTTNHDVKAVEYFLKNKFDELKLAQYKEFIHFRMPNERMKRQGAKSIAIENATIYATEIPFKVMETAFQSMEVMQAMLHQQDWEKKLTFSKLEFLNN